MGLVSRSASTDSIQEMDAARRDRFWDALTCGIDERHFAACYLFGYAIEMSLKVAYFRLISTNVVADLAPHLKTVGRQPRFKQRGRLHNVVAWADQLLEIRRLQGRPLSPALTGELILRAKQVAGNWSEVMRYRRSIKAVDEACQLLELAEWFSRRHDDLWR